MIAKCRTCGKRFDVLWTDLWRYKRNTGHGMAWLCSWKCLREYDRKEAEEMEKAVILTEEQKREACEMALRGENPLPYLKKLGVKNTTSSWDTCRRWAEKNWDPDVVDELPKRFAQPIKVTAKKIDIAPENNEVKVKLVHDPSIAEEYKREQAQKEANRKAGEEALEDGNKQMIFSEVEFRPLEISAVKSRVIEVGTYRNMGKMVLDIGGSDYLSMTAQGWRELSAEILVALAQLGIKE